MIQNYSYMDVADNSGAKQAMCFHVFGGTRRRYASLGDIVVVAVKEAIPHASVKKGDVIHIGRGKAWQLCVGKRGPARYAGVSSTPALEAYIDKHGAADNWRG